LEEVKYPQAELAQPTASSVSSKRQAEKATRIECYGAVLADGTMIDSIYEFHKKPSCSFVVTKPDGNRSIEQSFEKDGILKFPPERQLKRFENKSVILPSGLQNYGSSQQLVDRVKGFLHQYLDLRKFDLSLLTNYALMTWVADAWNAFPYLRFQGQPGTGKTRCLEVMKEICYRSVDLGVAPTRSALFRSIDSVQGTAFIDEADYEDDLRSALMKVLNAGYKKDGLVALSVGKGNNDWEEKTFNVGCPKVLASRHGFRDAALESRCITVETVFKEVDKRIPTELSEPFRDAARRLRNQLLQFRLDNWHHLDRNETSLQHLDGRAKQISLPIISVSPDAEFKEQFIEHMAKRSSALSEDDPVRIVLEVIVRQVRGPRIHRVFVQDVSREAIEKGREREIPEYVFTPKKVADIARGLLFETSKWGDGTVILINEHNLKLQRQRFRLDGDGADSSQSA
jgi:hypothetical protein